jgi:hypothetical protein
MKKYSTHQSGQVMINLGKYSVTDAYLLAVDGVCKDCGCAREIWRAEPCTCLELETTDGLKAITVPGFSFVVCECACKF